MAKTRRTNGGEKEDPWTGPYRFANGNLPMGPTTFADIRKYVLRERREEGELRGWLQWLVCMVVWCFREGGVHHIQATVQYVSSMIVAANGSGKEPCPHSSPRGYFVPPTRP